MEEKVQELGGARESEKELVEKARKELLQLLDGFSGSALLTEIIQRRISKDDPLLDLAFAIDEDMRAFLKRFDGWKKRWASLVILQRVGQD